MKSCPPSSPGEWYTPLPYKSVDVRFDSSRLQLILFPGLQAIELSRVEPHRLVSKGSIEKP